MDSLTTSATNSQIVPAKPTRPPDPDPLTSDCAMIDASSSSVSLHDNPAYVSASVPRNKEKPLMALNLQAWELWKGITPLRRTFRTLRSGNYPIEKY